MDEEEKKTTETASSGTTEASAPSPEVKDALQKAPDSSESSAQDDKRHENRVAAILAYIGPLIIVSFLMAKDDPFAKFHIKQGLLLVIAEVILWMLAMMFWPIYFITRILHIFLFVLAIAGIIRASNGEMKPLPFVGHLAESFKY